MSEILEDCLKVIKSVQNYKQGTAELPGDTFLSFLKDRLEREIKDEQLAIQGEVSRSLLSAEVEERSWMVG